MLVSGVLLFFFSFSATRQSHRCLGWCAKSLHAFRLYRFNIFQFNVLIVNAHRFIVLSFQREMDLFSVRISCVNLCTAQREQQKEPCTHTHSHTRITPGGNVCRVDNGR